MAPSSFVGKGRGGLENLEMNLSHEVEWGIEKEGDPQG